MLNKSNISKHVQPISNSHLTDNQKATQGNHWLLQSNDGLQTWRRWKGGNRDIWVEKNKKFMTKSLIKAKKETERKIKRNQKKTCCNDTMPSMTYKHARIA